MRQSLALLLPALLPSWRFFDVITASPRIEYALIGASGMATNWQEFRPRPAKLPLSSYLIRLFWNPDWNETLFLVSCSERHLSHPNPHSLTEIENRLLAKRPPASEAQAKSLQFRIILVSREGMELTREVAYLSEPMALRP